MIRTSFALVVTATAGLTLAQPAFAQVDDRKLGTVQFETSCTPDAQNLFDHAMLYQHSFWYRASQKFFEDVLKADPGCGIAYWGIGLSLLLNPHAPTPAKNLAEGAAALAKGRSIGAKTQRERDYLDALAVMYADYEKVDHRSRIQAYAKAMEQLALRYPERRRGADPLRAHAQHLGFAGRQDLCQSTQRGGHSGDNLQAPATASRHSALSNPSLRLPPLAEKGLDAARRYAKIAPEASHAQHMPSHIFTRVGYWRELIASNTSRRGSRRSNEGFHDQLHAMDYLVYAYLQLGQDGKAKAVIDEMTKVAGFSETFLAGPYALAASPARYAVERGDWKAAAALQIRPSPLAMCKPSRISRARSARPAPAIRGRQDRDRETRRVAGQAAQAKDAYWSEQVDIQRQVATAWVLYAEKAR